jgi:cytochrome c oxidase cbb3-type subunit III
MRINRILNAVGRQALPPTSKADHSSRETRRRIRHRGFWRQRLPPYSTHPIHEGILAFSASCLLVFAFAGCDQLPGKPKEKDRWRPPEANKNFADLYATNCLGCHSNGETISASISMHDPLYLQVIPKETMRKIIATRVPGTTMPGFAQAVGGDLTDEQIDVLVQGIYEWSKGNNQTGLPPYSAPPGDAHSGAAVYAESCADCHGKEGTGGKAGSVVDPSYLSLTSDQYLRSVIIAGRPELGMPNYQRLVPGKPLTAEQIADVVGWLASHRPSSSEEAKPATVESN